MKYFLVVHPAAAAEFDEAAIWYENQRPGLGILFVEKVQMALDTILNNPVRFAFADSNLREAPVSKFPFCIYFRINQNRIAILSIFHTSRNPSIWQSRK
jgi:toxin ParE1/3/4